jgi:hypothetical protein
MAKGDANKLFVIPSELQDLAGVVGALAGGASMASEKNENNAGERKSLQNRDDIARRELGR